MAMKSYISLVLVALFMSLNPINILTVRGRTLSPATGNDDFECVLIHEQPAFKNPLLKDHKIQLEPTFIPKGKTSTRSSLQSDGLKSRLKLAECANGTVPIFKTRNKDFLTTQLSSVHSTAQDQFQQHYSVVSVVGEYYGAQAEMNVLTPKVTESQMSMAVVRVEANDNMIQAGWAVAPQIYNDFKSHLTIYFSGEHLDCYNLLCPGFVQVDNKVAVGMELPTSQKDTDQNKIHLLIHQDKATKNWWLSDPVSNANIGYWPPTIFSTLKASASYAAFGGFVTSSLQEPSPEMGYGTFPEGNYQRSGFVMDMQIMDKNGQKIGIGDSWTEKIDSPKCYNVKRYGPKDGHGYSMEYGGPGGEDC